MPHDQDEMPVEWVSKDIIRQYFNRSQILDRVRSGELTTYKKWHSHLDPPPEGEPFCTESQILYYYTQNNAPIAVVHQYLRPDGTLGGSGLPDPKKIVLKDRILSIRETK